MREETHFWRTLPDYEGYKRKIHEIDDVVFTHEVIAWRDDRPETVLKAMGVGEEGAIVHSTITINREICKLGS